MWSRGNLHDQVKKLHAELDEAQIALDVNPHSNVLRMEESRILKAFNNALLDEEMFLKQKAKIEWLRVGDSNSSYFHKVIKGNINWRFIQLKNYPTTRGPPRCAFKVDIQKAYDTVDWSFLRAILCYFGFHTVMVDWIMKCVSTASFSINVNGVLHGYFKGKRGLRQGDPTSPYLFTLVMEVLTLMLKRNVTQDGMFQFHPKCERQEIINVCFADDLFLFAYANADSVQVTCDALEEFKNCSGLVPSFPKSTIFFSNVLSAVKNSILDIMPYEEGVLPVKYLDVPLISSGLFHKDCKILVERVNIKIEDWKNKSLSFAGRVQLISSVKWINLYRLKDRNFWDIPVKFDSSYEWRKILQMRNVVRRFFFYVVGKGDRTSSWFDKWLDEGPLDAIISRRDIHRGGFNTDSVVRDLIRDNAWAWPTEWLGKYDILNSLNHILLNNKEDKLWWKHIDGRTQSFTVANVWNSIRPRSNKVDWFDVVWFSQSIPRHSFLVWLLIGERLKTQDKLKAWEVESSVNIDNLKFWSKAKALIHIPRVDNSWRSFVMAVKPIAHMRWAKVIVAKLLFSATVYFVWQERNNRLFNKKSRSVDQVFEIIFSTTRLKLMTLKFKDSTFVDRMKIKWNLHPSN
ncbi:hypothetical protein Tco_1533841 [Tanacetum coccineum]